ncbi:hypothetical protein [Tissierella sp.]|uniref:hypothetical protein n=1 Tax=Tissierella sp. TaxID=41274 RepID=UPI00304A3105
MGYIIIKHFDVSEDMRDYNVLKTERLQVENGEYVLHSKVFDGYENIPYPEPPIPNPNICNEGWMPPKLEPIPFGSQRVTIYPRKSFGYVEFYYKKVKE